MKKTLIWAMVLTGIMLTSCTNSDDATESEQGLGSIYGIVTELGTAEPMKAMGVELYKDGGLLLKTVTFDDGHYEFKDLKSGNYKLKIMAEGYEQTEYDVLVESGRQARADMQAVKVDTHMTVRTTKIDVVGKEVTLNGEYTYKDTNSPSEVGFMYATHDNPKVGGTIIKAKVDNTTKSFSSTLNELDKGIYYVQAYAKNPIGTAFGDILSFEIKGTPAVRTLEATNVTAVSATLNGEIVYVGSPVYTERGFVYSTTMPTPTVDDKTGATFKVTVSGSSKEFSANINNLTSDATYHVRAYITNSSGSFYGEVQDFIPASTMAEVKTFAATNILANTATLNGEVTNSGSPAYTERGFVYSKSYNTPTIEDPASATTKVVVPGTNTKFSANVASLTENATYYVRAFATNVKGTAYGEILTFVPKAILPVVTTLEATNILPTSATLHGRIENAGEPAYTERGFLYSKSYPTPTINDPSTATSKVVVAGTTKEFSANLSSLEEGATYYVRAYATSNKGTSYGEVLKLIAGDSGFVIINNNLMVQTHDLGTTDWPTANEMCQNSHVAGFSDWRLPTLQELELMYHALEEIPNLSNTKYWSSSEYYSGSHRVMPLSYNYGQYTYYAWNSEYWNVRAVRTVK